MKINIDNSRLFFVGLIFALLLPFCFMSVAVAQSNMTPAVVAITPCSNSSNTGSAPANGNPYNENDLNPGVFMHLQFPYLDPNSFKLTNDNYMVGTSSTQIAGPDLTPCTAAPWKDPVLTYAATLYCQSTGRIPPNHILDRIINGPVNGNAGEAVRNTKLQQELYKVLERRASAFMDKCTRMLAERISIPSAIGGSGSTDLQKQFTKQTDICRQIEDPLTAAANEASKLAFDQNNSALSDANSMTASPQAGTDPNASPGSNPNTSNYSLGIGQTGHEVDGAIASCNPPGGSAPVDSDTSAGGLSYLAQDALRGLACSDPNHVAAEAGNKTSEANEGDQSACQEKQRAYLRTIDQEINDLNDLANALDKSKIDYFKAEADWHD